MKKSSLSEEAQIKQEKFGQFMNLIGLSERTILNYFDAIRTCSKIVSYTLERKGYSTIYDINDPEEMRFIQQMLEQNPEYLRLNKTGNNRYSAGLVNYIKFLDFLFIFAKKK